MPQNLLISVVGNRNSGKSTTWNKLFGRTVKTGKVMHKLKLSDTEWVEVFLVSGSPEERKEYVGDLITVENPRIVLCSLQYRDDVWQSFDYFIKNNYFIFTHWLNPGYNDGDPVPDNLHLISGLLDRESLVGKRDGTQAPESRVQEIRDFIRGWAYRRQLIHREIPKG